VWLSAVNWDFPLMGRTRMLTDQWLEMGQSVQVVEKPSYRSLLEVGMLRATPDHVIRPWPNLGAGRTRSQPRLSARLLRSALERRAPLEESVALVVSPLWLPWLEHLPFRHVVYDCIDDVRVMTPSPELRPLYASWEKRLIERASAVIGANDTLTERILRRHPDLPTMTIRNGCPADDFARRADAAPRPVDLPRETERPLVGFVGALYEWFDWELIERVSEKRPELEFVLIGPQRDGHSLPPSLRKRENVHFLGPRPYHEVPAYLAHFDLCWLPFLRNGVSDAANPVKIYEYLAVGKPVVSTPVADMESYERQVDFGRNAEEMAELIRLGLVKALAPLSQMPGAQSAVLGRRAFAQRQDWRSRAADYIDFIGSTFGREAG